MMKCPLRTLSFFVLASLCLCRTSFAYSGNPANGPALSDQENTTRAKASPPLPAVETAVIPGPLRSFMRMAAVSQKVPPEDILPLLSRNVFMQGYQRGAPTEFLLLVQRYIQQARELQILAGDSNTIRVRTCDDAGTLVQILGYRLREGCGSKSFFLDTANPERAFLTIDSGFP